MQSNDLNNKRRSFLGTVFAATVGGGLLSFFMKPKTAKAMGGGGGGGGRLSLADLQAQIDSLATDTVPPGTVIDWWQFNSEPIPVGYAICNGQIVNGFQTPNLSGQFVRGGTSVGAIGSMGGAPTANVGLPSRSVSVTVPAHDHVAFSYNPPANVYVAGNGQQLAPSGSPPGLPPGSASGPYRAMGVYLGATTVRTSTASSVNANGSTTSNPSVQVPTIPPYTTLLKLVKLPNV